MTRIAAQLDQRCRDLGMSHKALAQRAGLSWAAVQRLLSQRKGLTYDSLVKIAIALAAGIYVDEDGQRLTWRKSVTDLRFEQARKKARQLVAMTQGTAGLEAQAVDDDTRRRLEEQFVIDLLRGSNRKLWAA